VSRKLVAVVQVTEENLDRLAEELATALSAQSRQARADRLAGKRGGPRDHPSGSPESARSQRGGESSEPDLGEQLPKPANTHKR
jgi:hypothetical protein